MGKDWNGTLVSRFHCFNCKPLDCSCNLWADFSSNSISHTRVRYVVIHLIANNILKFMAGNMQTIIVWRCLFPEISFIHINPYLFSLGKYMDVSYTKPWMRFGPYAVGLWAGFLLYKTANQKIKLSKLVVMAGWLASTGIALATIYGIIPWFDPAVEVPKGLGAFYAGSHRFGWGIVISWIIFACSRGYGGPVNTFLSWKAFIPLGRLSFCAYLISYNLQTAFSGRQLQVTTYDTYTTVRP